MDKIVNWSLLKEPYNWIIVFLMVAIGLIALTILQPQISE